MSSGGIALVEILNMLEQFDLRKEGRWVYYSLPEKEAPASIRSALDWVDLSLAKSEQAAADAKRLKQVLKINPTELCRKQCRQ